MAIYDGNRRARAEPAEVIVGHEPGMATDDGLGGASEVVLIGDDGDYVIFTVEDQLWSRW
jgi:hypothetical protein